MKNDKKKVRHQQNRIILIHFLSFVLFFIILGFFIFGLVHIFFFKEVNKELFEFKDTLEENIVEYESEGKRYVSINPRLNARIFVILYQEDGTVFAFDRNLLNFLGKHLEGFHNNPEIKDEDISENLKHDIFQYNPGMIFNLEKVSDKEVYHFQTFSFALDREAAPSVKACKLLIMVNGELESRNLVIRVYFLASFLMFIFAFVASLLLSKMSIKPIKAALDKQLVFVSDASHELRTPLAIVRNRLENILTKSNKTVYEVSDDIAVSLKEITRLSKLTSDLLTLAHSDNERLQLKMDEFDLLELIKDVAVPFSEMAEIQNKNFLVAGEKCVISADKEKISQLLIILFDNALKYTAEKEDIEISLTQNGNEVHLDIADTGVGIADEVKPFVFERFFRADKARSRETGGNGLGLSIAKTIVQLHRGNIFLADNSPSGTKFTVILPKNRKLEKK